MSFEKGGPVYPLPPFSTREKFWRFIHYWTDKIQKLV